ncbi:MAG: response regulator [Nitrospirae bacterium]|nr:response regulator [Nitrospirota bacterium]
MIRQSLSTREAARVLEVDINTVKNWVDSGEIRAHKTVGGHRRILRHDLMAFMTARGFPVPQAVLPTPTVLVVDDEQEFLESCVKYLRAKAPDLEVVSARDGFEAGRLAERHRPQMIFLDVRLPGIDGVEVCRRISSDPHLRSSVVIGMTGFRSSPEVQRLRDAGAREVLFKPFELRRLIEMVEMFLGREERRRVPVAPLRSAAGTAI